MINVEQFKKLTKWRRQQAKAEESAQSQDSSLDRNCSLGQDGHLSQSLTMAIADSSVISLGVVAVPAADGFPDRQVITGLSVVQNRIELVQFRLKDEAPLQ